MVRPDELDAMITSGGNSLVELPIELLLEIDPLGSILLDKIRALDRREKIGRKRHFRL